MFGFGKKAISASEFGLAVLTYTDNFISNDACRSLACGFSSYDASRGWAPVFASSGISDEKVRLYVRLFSHGVLQAAFKQFPLSQRRSMTRGAFSAISDAPSEYDFISVFDDLEAVFDRRYKFDTRVSALTDSRTQNYLAEPTSLVLLSQYLIDHFVLYHLRDNRGYFEKFDLYSGTTGAALTTVHRAIHTLNSQFKLSQSVDVNDGPSVVPATLPDSPGKVLRPQEPPPQIRERQGFKVHEFVVYPAHGVGQILAIEQQDIAGAKLELFVINFMKDKMTLRVPTAKVANVGMRKLSDPATVKRAYFALGQPPQEARAQWSTRAQEYDAKINSGDLLAIAEVTRDLYRREHEQSYGERQLYEAALDRLSREVAVVLHLTEADAIKECESLIVAGVIERRK
jgi:CarD family transcriptional regulator